MKQVLRFPLLSRSCQLAITVFAHHCNFDFLSMRNEKGLLPSSLFPIPQAERLDRKRIRPDARILQFQNIMDHESSQDSFVP